jgi:hypothetical protein
MEQKMRGGWGGDYARSVVSPYCRTRSRMHLQEQAMMDSKYRGLAEERGGVLFTSLQKARR